MEFSDYANMVAQSVQQNNEWSAQQAAQQMAFQERMSNTAHQREIADLKAAGLNPVLSAKLGGASTPSGASASGDTSGTAALVDLIGMAMETANSAAGAAQAAAQSVRGSGSGRVSVSSDVQDNSASMISRLFSGDPNQEQSALSQIADDLYNPKPRNLKQIGQNAVAYGLQAIVDMAKRGDVPPVGTSAYNSYQRLTGASSNSLGSSTNNLSKIGAKIADSFSGLKKNSSSHTFGNFGHSGNHKTGKF